MKPLSFVLVLGLGLVFGLGTLQACSDDKGESSSSSGAAPQGSASSCDLTADVGYCLDFEADAPQGQAKGNCDGAKSTLGYNGTVNEAGSCPAANRAGTCVATISGVKTTYRYYSPKFTTAAAETNCKNLGGTGGQGGQFTAN